MFTKKYKKRRKIMINRKIKKIILFLLLFILTIAMSGSFARIININHNVDG